MGEKTEHLFNNDFWDSKDVLINTLDNVEARNYVDSKAVFHDKPLVESATTGHALCTRCVAAGGWVWR